MKHLLRIVAGAVCLTAAVAAQQAQNLAGQWQGTLNFQGKDLRLVFVLTPNAASGGYTATMHSIDQGGQGISATVVTQGGAVRLTVAPAGITFEGKLAADGNSLVGTFTQGPGSLPLTLARATKETAFALPAPPRTMAADAPLTFEVASIKPSVPGAPGKLFTVKGRDVMTINTTLADLMTMAYNVHLNQISGGPSWWENDKYDITARPVAEGVPNVDQLRGLLRSLLADRFQLSVHTDKREMQAYVLTVGNGGHKMTPNTANPTGLPGLGFKQLGVLGVVNANMGHFVGLLQGSVLDRPVVDKTGLQGRFDFTLSWTPDDSQFRSFGPRPAAPATPDANAPPGLFTAIQEQLGLRLERGNAPVEVIVIDRVEKPSEN
jgi:uncharacterized protein (TIGR03435 family)